MTSLVLVLYTPSCRGVGGLALPPLCAASAITEALAEGDAMTRTAHTLPHTLSPARSTPLSRWYGGWGHGKSVLSQNEIPHPPTLPRLPNRGATLQACRESGVGDGSSLLSLIEFLIASSEIARSESIIEHNSQSSRWEFCYAKVGTWQHFLLEGQRSYSSLCCPIFDPG